MSAPTESDPQSAGFAPPERVFLVVVDESDELKLALRYASRRAQHTGGRVALLFVIEPSDLQQWAAVETLMREEQREQAEALLQKLSAQVAELAGTVLAASAGAEGPGPLITALTGKALTKLRVPITIVPGSLTEQQLDALT